MTYPSPEELLRPETPLEKSLIAHPDFRMGLLWGVPRHGHPEGAVLFHIREVLDNIDAMVLHQEERRLLRLVALVHDTFKYKEEALRQNHQKANHGHLAAEFLKDYSVPEMIIRLIHWHDEAYYAWRMDLRGEALAAQDRLARLYRQLKPIWSLFLAFFQADTLTGDKNPDPLRWLSEQRILSPQPHL